MTQFPGKPGPKQQPIIKEGSVTSKSFAITPQHIDTGKRIVALIIDFVACYFVGIITAMIPFVNKFVTVHAAMIVFWLAKDFLFAGHGIGKNLMGLRVVDMATGESPTLVQSAIRNVILIAPFTVLEILNFTLSLLSFNWINNLVMPIINIGGTLYVIIILPLEAYRAYSREDSMRKGDELAGTCIVEAPMDFSTYSSK